MALREFNYPCPKCTNGIFVALPLNSGIQEIKAECRRCHHKMELDLSESKSYSGGGAIDQCINCGCKEFYQQKDFSRIIGIGLIVLGCILAPYTYYISLFVLSLFDFLLYRRLKLVTVCYGCEGVYRGQPLSNQHGGFSLLIRDQYRFGKPKEKEKLPQLASSFKS